jgi:flagellar biogenesis protein FliO
MNNVAFGALIIRMLVSLAVVLGLILCAYLVAKRRRGGSSISSTGKSTSIVGSIVAGGVAKASGAGRRPARTGISKRGLQTLGRLGLSRTSNVLAVQFADRVYLVGTSDSDAPAVLADVSMDTWLEAIEPPEDASGLAAGAPGIVGVSLDSKGRPKLLDALRDRTARRG